MVNEWCCLEGGGTEIRANHFLIRCSLKQSMADGVSAFCYKGAPVVPSTFVTHTRNQDSGKGNKGRGVGRGLRDGFTTLVKRLCNAVWRNGEDDDEESGECTTHSSLLDSHGES